MPSSARCSGGQILLRTAPSSSDKAKPPAVSPGGLWDSLATRADAPSPIAVLDTNAAVPSLPGPDNCVCEGYVCACLAYDPERSGNESFDFDRTRQHRLWVNACVYNLLFGDKAGFSLHAKRRARMSPGRSTPRRSAPTCCSR